VAGHRRDDENVRAFVMPLAVEMLELPEGLAEQDLLVNRDFLAADVRGFDPELRLPARRGGMGEDLEARRDHWPHRAVTPGVGRIVEPAGS
jgi:hypothetical protein